MNDDITKQIQRQLASAQDKRAADAKRAKRVDLLDNPVAAKLGVQIDAAQRAQWREQVHGLWRDAFDPDRWDDGNYMDDVRQATLRGTHPAARLLFWCLALCLTLFLLWASLARLDEVTHAQGTVIPSGKVQVVGSPEGGVVREILVEAGQIVNAGDVLVRLDDASALAGVGEKQNRRAYLQANVIRLQAEVDGVPPSFPPELMAEDAASVAEAQELYDNRIAQLNSTRSVFEEQVEQRRQELGDAKRRVGTLGQVYNLAVKELNMTKPYLAQGAIAEVDILRLQRQVADAQRELNTAQASVPSAEAALREAESKLEEAVLTYQNEARDELGKFREEFNRLGASVVGDIARVDRATLKSPIRAEVKQVLVNTVGQAVQANANIVELVPIEETLLLEAKVRPQDIAFIRPGLPAMVKISAFDFSVYGGLPGKVERISGDSFKEERSGPRGEDQIFYKVLVRTQKNYLERYGQKLSIKSGMVASVDVITGHKTVLEYLLKPINKARQQALTER